MTAFDEVLSDILSFAESLTRVHDGVRSLSDTLVIAEDLDIGGKKVVLQELQPLSEILSKKTSKSFIDVLNIAEEQSVGPEKVLLDETQAITEILSRKISKVLSEELSLIEVLTKSITKIPISDVITFTEILAKKPEIVIAGDVISFNETVVRNTNKVLPDELLHIGEVDKKYVMHEFETTWYNNPYNAALSLESKLETLDTTNYIHLVDIVDRGKRNQFKGVLIYGQETT